ncbi:MAG: pantetheine-phosphate adenylyltransferase [Synergistaceae bacterium]|nr:pantetheine-phosphate adenylyltransferase [Synergistaceae bacterium]
MLRAVYPGSFDPFTNGHLDITRRGAAIFDELIVAVLINKSKKTMFDIKERRMMAQDAVKQLSNVRVSMFDGLLVDFMRKEDSKVILRGIRALSDFEYEFQLAQMNKQLSQDTETFFMVTDAKYSYLSSSGVKEVFQFGGAIQEFVPEVVLLKMQERLHQG